MDRRIDDRPLDGSAHTRDWLDDAAVRLAAEHPRVPGYVVVEQLRQAAAAVDQLGGDVRLRELAVAAAEVNIERIAGALVSGGDYSARAPTGGST